MRKSCEKKRSEKRRRTEERGESSLRSHWKSLELICTVGNTEGSIFRKDGCQLCQSSALPEECACPKDTGVFNLTKGKHKWVWIKLRLKCSVYSVQSFQSFSHVQLSATPWTATRQASLSITNSQSLLKFMSIALVMPSNHLILWCPLLILPSIFPSNRVFSNELVLHIRWLTYWSFSFSISLSSEYSGLISFRTDWLDFLAVQGTLKSLLQHHSSKASILQCSAFFIQGWNVKYPNHHCNSITIFFPIFQLFGSVWRHIFRFDHSTP